MREAERVFGVSLSKISSRITAEMGQWTLSGTPHTLPIIFLNCSHQANSTEVWNIKPPHCSAASYHKLSDCWSVNYDHAPPGLHVCLFVLFIDPMVKCSFFFFGWNMLWSQKMPVNALIEWLIEWLIYGCLKDHYLCLQGIPKSFYLCCYLQYWK